MTGRFTAEQHREVAAALRYTLAVMDATERIAAEGDPGDPAGLTMDMADAIALAPALAHLAIAARRELARQAGCATHEEQARAVRAYLLAELDGREASALLAAVEEETGGAAAPPSADS